MINPSFCVSPLLTKKKNPQRPSGSGSEACLPHPCLVKVKVKSLSRLRLFVTPWTVAHQAPQSMEILQARILEWVAISSSRESSRPRDWTRVSHIAGRHFTG